MANSIALVRENQWTSVMSLVSDRDADKTTIRLIVDDALKRNKQIQRSLALRTAPIELEKNGEDFRIKFSNVAGLLKLSSLNIQIAPKFILQNNREAWQRSVLKVIQRVKPNHILQSGADFLNQESLTFIDHIGWAFIMAVQKGKSSGSIVAYRAKEINEPVLRGKLDIRRQMSQIFSRPGYIAGLVDELSVENESNYLLHWALTYLKQFVFSKKLYNELSSISRLLPQLENVGKLTIRKAPYIPPQFASWNEAINIAVMLARGVGVGQSSGFSSGFGFLLNMEKTFEKFIEKSLPKTIPYFAGIGIQDVSFVAQHEAIYAKPLVEGESPYHSIPDNILYIDGRPKLIVDVKYKQYADRAFRKRADISDIYQLFAALISHECEIGLLIFPKVQGDESQTKIWKVEYGGATKILASCSIDISYLENEGALREFDRRLFSVLSELLTPI